MREDGLPSSLPAPGSRVTTPSPPQLHPGPADTSSVECGDQEQSGSQWQSAVEEQRPMTAAEYLDRGPGPGALNPMHRPDEQGLGLGGERGLAEEVVARRRTNAIHHMAMAYRRLYAADLDRDGYELHQTFSRLFGEEYEQEAARTIMEEEDDTSVSSEGEDE